MPTLHMETEIARKTQGTIVTTKQEVAGNLQRMSNGVDELRSNWQGNSASQFFQEYDQFRNALNSMLDTLAQMGSHLQNEIEEWEQVAARFE